MVHVAMPEVEAGYNLLQSGTEKPLHPLVQCSVFLVHRLGDSTNVSMHFLYDQN